MPTSPLLLGATATPAPLAGTVIGEAKLTASIAAPTFTTAALQIPGLTIPVSAAAIAAVIAAGCELDVEVFIPWFSMGSVATYTVTSIYEDGVGHNSEVQSFAASGFGSLRCRDVLAPAAGAHTYSAVVSLGAASAGNSVFAQAPPGVPPSVGFIKVTAV